ncbi:MipA/OmpV family protein [Caballeronia sp. DA-9]|uniref:MipA/OmpV family protein n=1 Tax=Caballeronia sp. DA-9 TaxID=3436237 RepID=UPI003F66429E
MAISSKSAQRGEARILSTWKRKISALTETLHVRYLPFSPGNGGSEVRRSGAASSRIGRSTFDFPVRRFFLSHPALMPRVFLRGPRAATCVLNAPRVALRGVVKNVRRREYRVLLAAASLFLLGAGTARADDINGPEDSGFTILNNATNVTHWGLGGGVGAEPSPYRGDRARITPIPLFYIDNKWINAFATTLDLKVGQWSGVTFALRGRVGILEGYKASDAPILNGMQNRDSVTFWYGPAIGWHTGFGTLTASYLVAGNKGQQASVEFKKTFELGKWTIEPHTDARWSNDKYVNYYYGVAPSEARAGRPAYNGTATLNTSIGTQIGYRMTQHQSISLDMLVTHLGSGISDSPLVGKRFIPAARLGYLYQFK